MGNAILIKEKYTVLKVYVDNTSCFISRSGNVEKLSLNILGSIMDQIIFRQQLWKVTQILIKGLCSFRLSCTCKPAY